MYNTFAGGAYENCAIGALGIMPYISATIILQLMTAVIPRLSKLSREEGGRAKIIQIGRVMTVFLCLGQGLYFALGWENPTKQFPGFQGDLVLVQNRVAVSVHDCDDHDHGHNASDVAGRANHRARRRQRRVAGHYHRHCRAAAKRIHRIEGHVFPRRGRPKPVQHGPRHRPGCAAGRRDWRRHRGDAGAAENSGSIRPARRGAEDVFRRHVVHAVARQLFRRDADHFCAIHPDVSGVYFQSVRAKPEGGVSSTTSLSGSKCNSVMARSCMC